MKQNNKTTKSIDGILKRNLVSKKETVFFVTKNTLRYSSFKLVGVFVLATLLTFSLFSVGGTISHYRDMEVSGLNKFLANPLAFDVLIDGQESVQASLQTEQIVIPIMTPHPDSGPIQYSVVSQMVGGDSSMCNEIKMFSTFPFPYDNKLLLLSTGLTEDTGAWSLAFSLPDPGLFPNTTCTVDLIYSGYNADVLFGDGYSDTQKVSITFNVTENLELRVQSFSLQTETLNTEEEVEEVEEVVTTEEVTAEIPETPAVETEEIVETPEEIEVVEEVQEEVSLPETEEQTSTPEEVVEVVTTSDETE